MSTSTEVGALSCSNARLKVLWLSGSVRPFVFGRRRIVVDDRPIAALDQEVDVTAGVHRISVRSSWARSNELPVTLPPASSTTLECEVTIAAFAAVVWGSLLGVAAAFLVAVGLALLLPASPGTMAAVLMLAFVIVFPVGFVMVAQASSRCLAALGHQGLQLRLPQVHEAGVTRPVPSVDRPIMGIAYVGAALLGLFLGAFLAPRAAGPGLTAVWMFSGAFCVVCAIIVLAWAAERFCGVRLASPLGFAVIGTVLGFCLLPIVISGTVTERHLWIPATSGLAGAAFGFFQERRQRTPPESRQQRRQ